MLGQAIMHDTAACNKFVRKLMIENYPTLLHANIP